MFQVPVIKKIPDQCQGYTGQRNVLKVGSLSLTVPSVLEDKQIRWQLERGISLSDAYKRAGAGNIIPDVALQKCIELVFKTPYFDPTAGEWKTAEGQFTCVGFYKCLQEYAAGQDAFPQDAAADRRLKIAPGVFSPSQKEESCIKIKFLDQLGIEEAYKKCGASDIIPRFPGGLELIQTAFVNTMAKTEPFPPMYEIIKRAYQMYAIQPPDLPEAPATSPPSPATPLPSPATPPPKKKKKPWIIYLVIGVLVFVVIKDSESAPEVEEWLEP